MNASSKIAALAPVSVAAVGLTQLHWMVSHFATIAELTAAVTVGTAMWLRMGRQGSSAPQRAAEPVVDASYTVRELPPVQPVAYPMSDEVRTYRAR